MLLLSSGCTILARDNACLRSMSVSPVVGGAPTAPQSHCADLPNVRYRLTHLSACLPYRRSVESQHLTGQLAARSDGENVVFGRVWPGRKLRYSYIYRATGTVDSVIDPIVFVIFSKITNEDGAQCQRLTARSFCCF